MERTELRITSTLLTRKPRAESLQVSVLVGLAVVFVSMLCWRDPRYFQLLSASPSRSVEEQEYWRLLTTMAVHADLPHLAVNTLFLLFFGYLLYGYFGFWTYPLVMCILGSLTTLLSLLTYSPQVVLIGASGLVYLMVSFWLVMYALIERTISVRKRLLRIVGLTLIVLIPTAVRPEVSYRTHFIGCAVGIVSALAYFQWKKREIRAHETVELESFERTDYSSSVH